MTESRERAKGRTGNVGCGMLDVGCWMLLLLKRGQHNEGSEGLTSADATPLTEDLLSIVYSRVLYMLSIILHHTVHHTYIIGVLPNQHRRCLQLR